jgi:hypothetical protein
MNARALAFALLCGLASIGVAPLAEAAYRTDVAYQCKADGYSQVARLLLSSGYFFEQWVPTSGNGRVVYVGRWRATKDSAGRAKVLGTDGDVLEFESVLAYRGQAREWTREIRSEERTRTASNQFIDFVVRAHSDVPQTEKFGILLRCAENSEATARAKDYATQAFNDARTWSRKEQVETSCDDVPEAGIRSEWVRLKASLLQQALANKDRPDRCGSYVGSQFSVWRGFAVGNQETHPVVIRAQCGVFKAWLRDIRRICGDPGK